MTPDGQNYSLLLVEDHHDIADMICEFLETEGYLMDYAADGVTGLHLAVSNQYDVIILDLNLPGMDGINLLENLRIQARSDVPVLILTARDTLQNKVAGLDSGADDYLVKPFEVRELAARIRSLIRRRKGLVSEETLKVSDLVFDMATMTVTRNNQPLKLTPIGLQILKILMKASPRVVSRRSIEREIWGDILPDSDTLRSHMYTLRKAIDKPFDQNLLHTVQSSGYRLVKIDDEAIRD
jgi:DNA-binding response OmpR family regulator